MKQKIFILGSVFIFLFFLLGIGSYSILYSSNTAFKEDSALFFLPSGSSLDDLTHQLVQQHILSSTTSFSWAARLKRFRTVKPGRYRIKKNVSNQVLINLLRSGNQESVKVKLDGIQTLAQLAGRLSHTLEQDSLAFANALLDSNIADRMGFTPETFPSMFIADTYYFFWTTTPIEFIHRMSEEYHTLWTDKRKQEAERKHLTLQEVSTLAAIVKGETGQLSEAPIIAGLYLNRLKKNMPLQSDPTVIFSKGTFHQQRVLLSDIQTHSPYNTYQHTGLPPGPIYLVEKSYIDAVLNASENDYFYMCAQPENTGFHSFSRTYEEHQKYAHAYRKWLDKKGIRN